MAGDWCCSNSPRWTRSGGSGTRRNTPRSSRCGRTLPRLMYGRCLAWRAIMDEIRVAVDAAGIAVVTLNRPEKRNVVSLAMWQGLGEIYRDFARRSDVRVAILTGA